MGCDVSTQHKKDEGREYRRNLQRLQKLIQRLLADLGEEDEGTTPRLPGELSDSLLFTLANPTLICESHRLFLSLWTWILMS